MTQPIQTEQSNNSYYLWQNICVEFKNKKSSTKSVHEMPFQNIEGTKEAIHYIIKENESKCCVGLLNGPAGSGKTRLLLELDNIVNKDTKNKKYNVFFITLNQINKEDINCGSSKSIALRLLHSVFFSNEYSEFLEICKKSKMDLNSITLEMAIDIAMEGNNTTQCIIAIDECLKENYNIKKDCIMDYINEFSSIFSMKMDSFKPIFFISCSTMKLQQNENFYFKELLIKSFTHKELENIINSLVEKNNILAGWENNLPLKTLINAINYDPISINALFELINEYADKRILMETWKYLEMVNYITEVLSERLEIECDFAYALIEDIILQTKVSLTDNFHNFSIQYSSLPKLYNLVCKRVAENGKVRLSCSLVMLLTLLKKVRTNKKYNFLAKLVDLLNGPVKLWQEFELYCWNYEYIKSNLIAIRNTRTKTRINIGEYYGLSGERFESCKFLKYNMIFNVDKEMEHRKSLKKFPNERKTYGEKLFYDIILNADKAPFADIFRIVTNENGKKCLLLIQCKFNKTRKLENDTIKKEIEKNEEGMKMLKKMDEWKDVEHFTIIVALTACNNVNIVGDNYAVLGPKDLPKYICESMLYQSQFLLNSDEKKPEEESKPKKEQSNKGKPEEVLSKPNQSSSLNSDKHSVKVKTESE